MEIMYVFEIIYVDGGELQAESLHETWNMEMIGFAHSQNVVSENKEKDQFD